MRTGIISAIILLNFILQTTVLQYIPIFGATPNTALVFVVCYAILRGDAEGGIVGLAAGLLRDIYFGPVIGVHALLCMLTGFLCGKPFKHFFRENYAAPVILVAASTFIYEFVYYVFMLLPQGKAEFMRVVLPVTAYTVLFALPVYHMTYMLNHKLEEREKRRGSMF